MRKIAVFGLCALLCFGLAGCESKQDAGVITGGLVGGLLGSTVGGGSGQAVAIAAGTIAGAVIGGAIGKSMDQADQAHWNTCLENNKVNQSTSWHNPDTGNTYTVTPVKTYKRTDGRYCREYQTHATINGERQKLYGKACRQPDGSWKAVK